MTKDLARRDFLKASAAFAGAAATNAFSCVEIASAAPIAVPTVDKLSIRVLVDSSYDQFFRPKQANGVSITPPPRGADYRKTLHNEWGLSLWLESQAAGEQRTLMLDFGYTPEVLLNNMELVGVDPSKTRRADRQPRPLRSFRRPARLPRQVPRHAAGRRQALCRRRGQFLPSRQRRRRPRASSPISARSTAASSPRRRSRPCCAKRRP